MPRDKTYRQHRPAAPPAQTRHTPIADLTLTGPQRRALEVLAQHTHPTDPDVPSIAARQVAKALWPDSPGWERRTRRYGGANRNGAVGGTMPMKAGTLLGRLVRLGVADEYLTEVLQPRWTITTRGRQWLEAHPE